MSAAKVYAGVDRFIDAIDRPIMGLGLSALVIAACMLFVGAIYRYLLSQTITLFEETSVNMIIWSVVFFGGPLFKRGGHIGMDFLASKLNRKGQAVHQLISSLFLLLICTILVWKGMEIVQLMYMVGKTTNSGEAKIWVLMLPIPVGCALYSIYGVGSVIKVVCALINPALDLPKTSGHG